MLPLVSFAIAKWSVNRTWFDGQTRRVFDR